MQPSPDGRGFANNRRVLYDDAQLIVAAHGDPKLSAFLQAKKDYFEEFFTAHNTPATEVVTLVAAHERCGDAACLPDEDDAFYSPAAPGGVNRVVGANKAAEQEEESDENTRIREAAKRELDRLGMLKALHPKNIPAHVAQQLFVTILRRALGNYDEQMDLEKLLKRGRLMRTEGPSGPAWGTFYELSKNGVMTWLCNNHGVKVSWRVIERAIKNFQRFYIKWYGDKQAENS